LIIFDRNVTEKVGYKQTSIFPPYLTSASARTS